MSAVLCVHGFPLSHQMWLPVGEHLWDTCRLIMPDLRGHGRSAVTDEASMRLYADDLAGLLDVVAPGEPVAVCGLSMGGYIAFEFFRQYSSRVRALVLADTRAEADSAEAAANRQRLAQRVLAEGSHVVADDMVEKLFGPAASAALRQRWRDIMASTAPAGVAAALWAMAERQDSTATLKEIDVPALVIVGEDDRITPPSVARNMHANIRDARLHVIPDAGHVPPVETPRALASLLRQFVEKLPSSA